jgi:hypothetical protein
MIFQLVVYITVSQEDFFKYVVYCEKGEGAESRAHYQREVKQEFLPISCETVALTRDIF